MRLIDADALNRSFNESCNLRCDGCTHSRLDCICGLIQEAPTVEAWTWKQIAQIKYEIYQEVGNIDRSQYTTERAQGRADGIIFALGMALGIIGKYCNRQQDDDTQDLHK